MAEYGSMLRRVASGYVATRADREELVQDVVISLSHALRSSGDESLDRTLVLRVAHNRGVSFSMRKSRVKPRPESKAPVGSQSDRAIPIVVEQERERLSAAIRRLPEAQRQAVMLHLEGLTQSEIASIQGTTDTTVDLRLTRAHDSLRAILGGDLR